MSSDLDNPSFACFDEPNQITCRDSAADWERYDVINLRTMNPTRTAKLLQPFLGEAALSPAQLQSISTYIDMLLHWNARINLTAIRNEEEIVTRHFGESLFAARHLFPKVYLVSPVPPVVKGFDSDADDDRRPAPDNGIRVADLGSGAGFPGIPIKLWAPHIAMTLIESNHKKATFLREVVRSLTLTNIDIQNARAETLPPSSFEVITLRAVERLNQVLPVATNLLAPGGQLALLISSAQQEAIASILRNFAWKSSMSIPNSESRQLLVGRKEQAI